MDRPFHREELTSLVRNSSILVKFVRFSVTIGDYSNKTQALVLPEALHRNAKAAGVEVTNAAHFPSYERSSPTQDCL